MQECSGIFIFAETNLGTHQKDGMSLYYQTLKYKTSPIAHY